MQAILFSILKMIISLFYVCSSDETDSDYEPTPPKQQCVESSNQPDKSVGTSVKGSISSATFTSLQQRQENTSDKCVDASDGTHISHGRDAGPGSSVASSNESNDDDKDDDMLHCSQDSEQRYDDGDDDDDCAECVGSNQYFMHLNESQSKFL